MTYVIFARIDVQVDWVGGAVADIVAYVDLRDDRP